MVRRKVACFKKGDKVGRWTVLSMLGEWEKVKPASKYTQFITVYLCECECGVVRIREERYLQKPAYAMSCGCLAREIAAEQEYVHGLSKTKMYQRWATMLTRCYNENHPNFKFYGAKGIRVCDEWRNEYMSFLNWSQANGYREGLTIDRINPKGNYCPENCRWVTNQEQANNKSTNVFLEARGKRLTVSQWSQEIGVSAPDHVIRARIKKGWSHEEAIFEPYYPKKVKVNA